MLGFKSILNIFKKKELIVFAEPFKSISTFESAALTGLGSAVFITVLPVVSSSMGVWLACTTSGCASTATAFGGFAAGSSASVTTVGLGSYVYCKRYKDWTIKEAGKYVISNGTLQKVVPLAFIASVPGPITMIVVANLYSFTTSYLRAKGELDAQEDV